MFPKRSGQQTHFCKKVFSSPFSVVCLLWSTGSARKGTAPRLIRTVSTNGVSSDIDGGATTSPLPSEMSYGFLDVGSNWTLNDTLLSDRATASEDSDVRLPTHCEPTKNPTRARSSFSEDEDKGEEEEADDGTDDGAWYEAKEDSKVAGSYSSRPSITGFADESGQQ